MPHGKSGEILEIRIHNAALVHTSAASRPASGLTLDPQWWSSVAAVASNKCHVITDIGARSPTEPTAIAGITRVVRQSRNTFGEIKRVTRGVRCGAADCSIPGRLACGIADRFSASGYEAAHGMSSESSGHKVASRVVWQTERAGPCVSQYHSLTRSPDRVTWSSPDMRSGPGA